MKNSGYTLLISYCICLVVLCGCSNNNQDKTKPLIACMSLLTNNPKLKERIIFVIPLDGCSTCIVKSVNFLKRNYEGNCEFVISDKSFKKIKFKVGKLIHHKNIVLDTAVVFKSKQVVFNSPHIFYCTNGKIKSIIILSPQNIDNELMKLQEAISFLHKKAIPLAVVGI